LEREQRADLEAINKERREKGEKKREGGTGRESGRNTNMEKSGCWSRGLSGTEIWTKNSKER